MSVSPADPQPPSYWDWDAPTTAKPPRKKVPVAGIIVLVVLVGCLVGGLGLIAVGSWAERQVGKSSSTPRAADSARLRQYMMPAPADSHPWSTQPADQDVDLETVAGYSSTPTLSAAVLRTHKFQQAFVRRWIGTDGTIVELRLLQFGSSAKAADYLRIAVTANSNGHWGDASTVNAIDTGRTFVKSAPDHNGYTASMSTAAAGNLNVVVLANQPPVLTATPAIPDAILTAEYARLPHST